METEDPPAGDPTVGEASDGEPHRSGKNQNLEKRRCGGFPQKPFLAGSNSIPFGSLHQPSKPFKTKDIFVRCPDGILHPTRGLLRPGRSDRPAYHRCGGTVLSSECAHNHLLRIKPGNPILYGFVFTLKVRSSCF